MYIDLLFYITFIYVIFAWLMIFYLSWKSGQTLKKYLYKNNRIEDIEYLQLAELNSIMINKDRDSISWLRWIKNVESNEPDNKELMMIVKKLKNVLSFLKISGFGLLILVLIIMYFVG